VEHHSQLTEVTGLVALRLNQWRPQGPALSQRAGYEYRCHLIRFRNPVWFSSPWL